MAGKPHFFISPRRKQHHLVFTPMYIVKPYQVISSTFQPGTIPRVRRRHIASRKWWRRSSCKRWRWHGLQRGRMSATGWTPRTHKKEGLGDHDDEGGRETFPKTTSTKLCPPQMARSSRLQFHGHSQFIQPQVDSLGKHCVSLQQFVYDSVFI